MRATWRQATIHRVVRASPLTRGGENGRVSVYRVRMADGSRLDLASDVVCERLSNNHGEQISLPLDAAAHVLARHMRGQLGGVFSRGVTLTRLLRLFCAHSHDRLGYGPESAQIRVLCDRVIGTSGMASTLELAQRGVLSADDLERLAELKEEVFVAGVHGTAVDRMRLVARVNQHWADRNIRLVMRNGVVLPAFIARPQPTRSFVVVLDRPRSLVDRTDDQMWIRTLYPGDPLCASPSHARYMPLAVRSQLPVGATVGQLLQKRDRGEPLSEPEETALRDYRHAFNVWYENAPLVGVAPRRRGATVRRSDEYRPIRGATH